MKWRFAWVYRFGLILLAVVLFWSVWANAQPATNISGADTNSIASAPVTPYLADWKAPTLGLDSFPVLRDTRFLGQPLWKYAASALYILLAFCLAWLLDFIINNWLKRLASRTKTKYDDLVLDLVRGPVKVVGFVIFLNIGLGMFDWPEHARVIISRTMIVVVAFSMAYVVLKMIDLAFVMWRENFVLPEDKLFAKTLFPVLQRVVRIVVIIIAVVLTADNLNIKITSLLAGLSIGGLALGLAAQDTVANMFGAVAILLDKPFHIGDRIRVEAVDGTVESIGLRSTRVRSLDGHHVSIPNKLMGNAIITNITRRPTIKTEINIGLTYDTPAEKIKRATIILEEIFRGNPKTAELTISFNKFADSALNLSVIHVWNGTDAAAHSTGMQDFNLQIKQRFDAEKIEFAFPTRTIYLKSEAGK
jgi:MscS family membrane protein